MRLGPSASDDDQREPDSGGHGASQVLPHAPTPCIVRRVDLSFSG